LARQRKNKKHLFVCLLLSFSFMSVTPLIVDDDSTSLALFYAPNARRKRPLIFDTAADCRDDLMRRGYVFSDDEDEMEQAPTTKQNSNIGGGPKVPMLPARSDT
jgi:hypothetical protein